MNYLVIPFIVAAALTAKAGAFTFFWGVKKYQAVITTTAHTFPLGKLTIAQAYALAVKCASGNITGSYTVRIGADNYTIDISRV